MKPSFAQFMARLHPPEWVRLVGGPILDKELRVASRRRRTFALRFAYLVLLGLFVVFAWEAAVSHSVGTAYAASRMSEVGGHVVAVIIWFEFVAAQVMAVVMLSTAISEEVHRRTLGVLLSTPITSLQVVLGKLLGGLLQIGLLLAVSLPLLAVVRVFGGVPWDFVVAGLCLIVATALFAACLSLYFSIGSRRAYGVVLLAFGVLAASFVVVPTILGTILDRPHSFPYAKEIQLEMIAIDPYLGLLVQTLPLLGGWSSQPVPADGWHTACLWLTVASVLLVLMSARRVRRVAQGRLSGAGLVSRAGARPGASGARAADRPPQGISGSPVEWREFRTGLLPSIRAATWLFVVVATGGVLWCLSIPCPILVQPGFHAFVLLSLVAVGALVTAVTAATGITTEKEAGTWPVLLSTPLSASDVILGKAAGVLRRSAPAWVPAILYVVVYTATGLMEPVVGLYAAGASLGVFLFVAGAGLLVGVHARRTTAAVVLNLALAFALLVVAPLAGAYLNEMMYGERLYGTHSPLLSEIGYATDPLGMIYQVADSFSGYWAPEGHPFTRPFTAWRMWKSDDETSVLSYSLGTGLMYSGLGLYLAALAGVRLRKRIF